MLVQPDAFAIPLAIPQVRLIRPRRFEDTRGHFFESYSKQRLAEAGIDQEFVQDNVSSSRPKNTVRGLHFQAPPFAQAKLVQVLKGRIFDVVVDLRANSFTYGKHVSVVLDAANNEQIFIPEGFAHGFLTLEPDCLIHYKVGAPYSPAHEYGILWNDPDLAVAWPTLDGPAILSDRDATLPGFAALQLGLF